MRIILFYPSYQELLTSNLDPPLDLINVATCLRGHDVRLIDLRIETVLPEADIYGFTATTPGYPQMVKKQQEVKRCYPASRTIIGGKHASALPRQCLDDGFDKVFVGECDITLPQIVTNWDASDKIIQGELPLTISAYHITDWIRPVDYVRTRQGIFSILLSRGCSYHCRYCASTHKYRKMTLTAIEETINSLNGIKGLRFYDDNFLSHKSWFFKTADFLEELGAPYFIFCRGGDLCNDRIVNRLSKSGCKVVSIGFETASQMLHNNAHTLKKVKKMIAGIKKANEYGLKVRLNLMIGLPGETWDTIKQTVDAVNKLEIVSFSLNHFVPYPGTYWYKDQNTDFSQWYLARGINEGYHVNTQIKEWRSYCLENLKALPHSEVSGHGLL